jgi:ribose 5-phosphate isomerase A
VGVSGEPKTTDAEPSASDDLALLAERALEFVQAGSVVGLGSGTAASAFVRALGRRAQRGLTVTCVATVSVTNSFVPTIFISGIPIFVGPEVPKGASRVPSGVRPWRG